MSQFPRTDSERLDKIEATLRRIEVAVTGDPAMGHVGLVQSQADLRARITVLEVCAAEAKAQRKGAVAVIAAASAVAGAAGGAITWLANIMRG